MAASLNLDAACEGSRDAESSLSGLGKSTSMCWLGYSVGLHDMRADLSISRIEAGSSRYYLTYEQSFLP